MSLKFWSHADYTLRIFSRPLWKQARGNFVVLIKNTNRKTSQFLTSYWNFSVAHREKALYTMCGICICKQHLMQKERCSTISTALHCQHAFLGQLRRRKKLYQQEMIPQKVSRETETLIKVQTVFKWVWHYSNYLSLFPF